MSTKIYRNRPQKFSDQGFLVVRNLIPSARLYSIQNCIHELVSSIWHEERKAEQINAQGQPNREVTDRRYLELVRLDENHHRFIYDALRHSPELVHMVSGKKILGSVRKCLGLPNNAPITMTHVNLRIDRPGKEWIENLGWHQDSVYFDSVSITGWSAGLWVPLFDCNLDLGPPEMAVASHLRGPVAHVEVPKGLSRSTYIEAREPEVVDLHTNHFKVGLNAGDALLFDLDILHRSSINLTRDLVRWSVQARFHAVGCA